MSSTLERQISDYEKERGKPMPSKHHGAIQTNLSGLWFDHPDYRTLSELTLDLGEKPDLTPDLCVIPRQPLDLMHDEIRMTTAPLQVVEILSPTQGTHEILQRFDRYFAWGVKSCWLVFPPASSVTIYSPNGAEKTISTGIAKDPVTGLEADLAAVFS